MSWWTTDDPRRLTLVVAVLLGAAAIVGLGVGLLLGFAGDGRSTATTTSAPTTSLSPSATTTPTGSPTSSTATPTPRAASQIEAGTTEDVGYLVGSGREDDGVHVTLDRVIFRTGKAARDYARQYHKHPPGADGVLIVNDNELTRDLVLSPDVTVLGTEALAGTSSPTQVTLKTLRDAIDSQREELLLDLRYDKLGYVVEITEHDLP